MFDFDYREDTKDTILGKLHRWWNRITTFPANIEVFDEVYIPSMKTTGIVVRKFQGSFLVKINNEELGFFFNEVELNMRPTIIDVD